MQRIQRIGVCGLLVIGAGLVAGGCPEGGSVIEFIQGGAAASTTTSGSNAVEVFTPSSNLTVVGGTQIEVNWRGSSTSRFSSFSVFVDPDQIPDNGNEIFAFRNLALTENRALVDTTRLARGAYNFGVRLEESGRVIVADYAPGQISIDERPRIFFTLPRQNLVFDRSPRINPSIQVAYTLEDPDSVNTVEVYLDPDNFPGGNEILLFRSTNATGDSFSFDLPTAQFPAGEYRLLASISDARATTAVYAPITIRLRARVAGPVDLRNITNTESPIRGAVFEGFNPRDNAGSAVFPIPDIDGDGFDDFLIVSQFAKPRFQTNLQRTGVGEAYLIYGRQQRFSGNINLNSVGTLLRGDIYAGVAEIPEPIRPSRGITSFTVLSDWDNDGVREFAFGVPFTDSLSIATLDPAGYFRTGAVVIAASASLGNFAGGNVNRIGDFGVFDGIADAATQVNPDCRSLMTFYGPKAPTPPGGGPTLFYRYYPSAIPGPAFLGCRISTNEFGDQCGEVISAYRCTTFGASCGLIISVPGRNPAVNITTAPNLPGAGVTSIFFRRPNGNPWDLASTELPHEGPYMYILDDLRFDGSPGFSTDNDNAPPCSFFFTVPPPTPVPTNTLRVYGGFAGARLSESYAAGDINADGIDDILLGSPFSNGGAGASFVVFGRLESLVLERGVGAELAVEELGLPMNANELPRRRVFDGLRIVGNPGDRLGQSQSPAGDFNGDGIDDIVIGSPQVNNRRGGAAVFFGSRTVINLTEREIPYSELPQRGLGVLFVGESPGDLAGARVVGIGDVDRDGYDDILIAAPDRSVFGDLNFDGIADTDRTRCGVVYLVYGGPDLVRRATPGGQPGVLDLSYIGTEHLPGAVFIGRNSDDQLGAGIGEQGDRSMGINSAGDVDGDGRIDFLLGAPRAAPRDRVRAGEAYLIYGVGD